jgi:hypothetical protein
MSSSTVDTLVTQALSLSSSKLDPSKWNLDAVLQFAVEVAGLVKAVSASSKQQNFELLMNVVNKVLDQLQAKELASVPQGSPTADAVAQRWTQLKASVDATLPVVFSYTSHLSVPPVVGNCLAGFCSKVVELEEFVKVSVPVVEKAVESALPVVDEIAVAAGAKGVSDAVEKAEAELPKVEAAVNSVVA